MQQRSEPKMNGHAVTWVEFDQGSVSPSWGWRCACGAESEYRHHRPALAEWEWKDHMALVVDSDIPVRRAIQVVVSGDG